MFELKSDMDSKEEGAAAVALLPQDSPEGRACVCVSFEDMCSRDEV